MPLIKSSSNAARSKNIAAETNSGRPRAQAAAIAYRVQRDAKKKKMANGGRIKGYAPGGSVNVGEKAAPFYIRNAARQGVPGGVIKSAVPGRTDKVPLGVKGNSYVVPADAVSALGQGNTIAGAGALDKLFKVGPGGAGMGRSPMAKMPGKFAAGGDVMGAPDDGAPPVDIMAAGGEYVVPPNVVAELGGGDPARGHDVLDAMVTQIRKKAIKTLKRLPKPRKR